MLTMLFQYSIVHFSRIEINSINSTIRNRLLLQLFISEMIHAKQWHYSLHRDFQRLHSTHSTRRNPRNSSSTNSTYRRQKSSSSNSTCRRQRDLLSSLQGIPAARPSTGIPVLQRTFQSFQTFQSFMTFQPYNHLYTFQHLPVHQYFPVLSSVSRDSTRSSISSIRMQILHTDWFPPETPLSANQYKTFYRHYILQRKGDVAISVIRLTYSPE